jgi:putative MATE family efflux protein
LSGVRSGREQRALPEASEAAAEASLDPEGADLPATALAAGVAPALHPSARDHDSYAEIWKLSWPVMLSQALLNVVGLVDIAMVGRLGAESVAAVGYSTQFFHLSQAVLFAVGFACGALMANAIGAGHPERARRALAAALIVSVGAAVLLTSLMLGLAAPLLRLLGAAPAVVPRAIPYLQLVVGSSLLLAVSMTLEFGLRADRSARTPMLIAGVVTLVKLLGNALLIFGAAGFPRLELVGAGLATLISQVVGLALFLAVVVRAPRDSPLGVRARDFRDALPVIPQIVRLAAPSIGERASNNLALLAYFRVLSGYGSIAIAAYTVGIRLLAFTWIPGVGFGTAASTLVGQALGARDEAAAARAGWRAAGLSLVVAGLLGGVCLLMPEPLARLFTDDETLVHELVPFLLWLALAQPFLQAHFSLGGAHRGAGDTWTPFVSTSLGNWALRVPLAFVLALVLDAPVTWIWVLLFADHAFRAAWLAWSFRSGRWRRGLGR